MHCYAVVLYHRSSTRWFLIVEITGLVVEKMFFIQIRVLILNLQRKKDTFCLRQCISLEVLSFATHFGR